MVGIADIEHAQATIAHLAIRTPTLYSHALSQLCGAEVFLKLELLQRGGSFKVRGAVNMIAHLPPVVRSRGVIAASAGNHAQGVALAASRLGIPSTVVIPTTAPHTKAEASRAYGAEVIRFGASYGEAHAYADQLARERQLTVVPGFDHPDIIAGQGTVGLELLDDTPHVDDVLVPVGGGGLIAGIALAIRARRPGARLIGVQAAAAPAVIESLAAGRPTTVAPRPTLADGIAVERPGDLPFEIIQHYVDQLVAVGEADIRQAVALLAERAHVVAEGAGAAPLAAVLNGAVDIHGRTAVLVLSGGNIDREPLSAILAE
jgi:threonine dehydratase